MATTWDALGPGAIAVVAAACAREAAARSKAPADATSRKREVRGMGFIIPFGRSAAADLGSHRSFKHGASAIKAPFAIQLPRSGEDAIQLLTLEMDQYQSEPIPSGGGSVRHMGETSTP